jgi:phage terminase small subunit
MCKLSYSAKKLKKKLISEYSISDSGGLAILESGLQAYDRAAKARETIDTDGMVIFDRFGATKAHPLLSVERDARSQWLMALKALNLDLEPLNSGPGRPAGR